MKKWMRNKFRHYLHTIRYFVAKTHSRRLKTLKFVGITGSAGKTTTKDLAASILSSAGSCHSSPRSMNYPDGVARTILRANKNHQFCVLEVSGGNPNDLDRPLRLFTPDIAVLTLVARDHFKAFKSVEGIAAEKGKLIRALPKHGVAVLNIDDPLVKKIGEECDRKIIWVGEAQGATIRLLEARSRWPEPLTLDVEYEGRRHTIETQLYGKHLALSVISALGVGLAAGISMEDAISALAAVEPPEGRMQIVHGKDGVVFVRDDWKAPHWSLPAPIEFMREAQAHRKVLIIGTLSDYSLSASKLYPKEARKALQVGDLVVFVGPHALRALKAKSDTDPSALHAFTDIREAAAFLSDELRSGDLVLLKGSNKADHLVRLVYDREKPVQCWVARCGIQDFCGDCSNLFRARDQREPFEGSNPDLPVAVSLIEKAAQLVPIVVGLGNPGARYIDTPHNVGYQVVDQLANLGRGIWAAYPEGLVCSVNISGVDIQLLKPGVSINNSGPVTRDYLERTGISAQGLVVIHDEIDLPLGQAKAKHLGSDGGHKGVKSLIEALGSSQLSRVRVGIKSPGDQRTAEKIVLSRFASVDKDALKVGIDRAVAEIQKIISEKGTPITKVLKVERPS